MPKIKEKIAAAIQNALGDLCEEDVGFIKGVFTAALIGLGFVLASCIRA